MSKQNTFSHLLRKRRDWLNLSIAGLVLGLSVVNAPEALAQCHPATPCACAADGMCYPKRESWGSYTTHWRPFPGDSLTPTRADGGPAAIQNELPIYIVPPPEKEDLRGPVRSTRTVAPGATGTPVETQVNEVPAFGEPFDQAPPANDEQPAEPAAEEAPGPFDNLDLPGFGPPQGLLQPLPQIEDGPPALPSALSQAVTMGNGAAIQANFPTRAQATAVPTPTARANSSNHLPKTVVAQSHSVSPATANIELANPAAKKVQKTMDQDLHQAIYYEASDIDSAMK